MPRSAPIRIAAMAVVVTGWLGAVACRNDPTVRAPEASDSALVPTTGEGPTVVPDAAPDAAAAGVVCPDVHAVWEPGVRGLTDLVMASPRKGIAVGQGVIFVTDDGRKWEQRYSDPSWFLPVEMVDADHAWAVGQHSLLGTEDGGRSWLPLGHPTGTALRAVDFVDPSRGWGSDRKHVYRTTDGGRSWAKAFELPIEATDNQFNANSIYVESLECADGGSAWALFAGQMAGTERTPYVVYHGRAGGAWTPVLKASGGPPPAVAAPEGGPYPAPLDVFDGTRIALSSFTPSSRPSVAVTTASATGSGLGPWHPVPNIFSVTSVSFPGGTTGWVLGPRAGATNADALVMTSDGGRTWHEQLTRPRGTAGRVVNRTEESTSWHEAATRPHW